METRIVLAESAGFCFGVKRAVELVEKEADRASGPIYTYGPIIHNEHVVAELSARGVRVMEENADLSDKELYPRGTVVLRSHGVAKRIVDELENQGFAIVDATCPFVKKIHTLVHEHAKAGDFVVIVGNHAHPEVEGIVGWIPEGAPYAVISDPKDADTLQIPYEKRVFVVSQTTFRADKFEELIEIMRQKGYYINAVNTICSATATRQEEAARIAAHADVMLVIGGSNSSNSQKLFEICRKACKKTYFIQTAADLDPETLQSIREIGITAGASTPNTIIQEVVRECQK